MKLKNENKLEEMVDILDELHEYVPSKTSEVQTLVDGGTEADTVKIDRFHHIVWWRSANRSTCTRCSTCQTEFRI